VNLLQYLFLEDFYTVGCRKIQNNAALPSDNKKGEYSFLKPTVNYWYADPFVLEKGGKTYIFVEAYNLWLAKGEIGVTLFENERFSPVKSIIVKEFHMSYPNVFEWNSKVYMIPETSAANQIQLYEATDFPYSWTLKKVLVDHIKVVDTSVLRTKGGKLIIYSKENCDNGEVLWFQLEDDLSARRIDVSRVAQERPGGNPIHLQNEIFRPLQDCQKCYGNRLLLYKMNSDFNKPEALAQIVDSNCISNIPNRKYNKVHTINRSDNYEVIDAHGDFIDKIKAFRKVFRKLRMLLTRD